MDHPFPNKPVIHRRFPRTHGPRTSQDSKKITQSTQQRGHLSPEDCTSSRIQKTTEVLYSREDVPRQPNSELQMARAIHAKELMVQEKLWKVGEKIKHIIQNQSADTAANDQHKRGEERQYRAQAERGKVKTEARLSEHERKQPGRSKDMLVEESRHTTFKNKIYKQASRAEDRMKNNLEEHQARWGVAETPESKDDGPKGAHHVINKQKINRVPNKTRIQEINMYSKRKGGDEKVHGIGKKSEINDSKQDEASLKDTDWTKGNNYRGRTHRRTYNEQQEKPQKNLQKSAQRGAAENHESAGIKPSAESTLPHDSRFSHCSQQQRADETLISLPDDNLLLPCSFCSRTFRSERLEKHTQICKNSKRRPVYNMSSYRAKGVFEDEQQRQAFRAFEKECRTRRLPGTQAICPQGHQAGKIKPKQSR